MNILVIEDNRQEMALLRAALSDVTSATIRVEQADRLSAAFSRLDAGGIDAILLDLNLPDSDGLDTLARVQARVPEVPIVILTGLDDERLATDCVRAGAQDYLVKGRYDGALFSRALRYAIERKRLVTDLESRVAERTAELEVANQAMQRDIIARTRAEETLRESEQRYKTLVERAPLCIHEIDVQGRLLSMNPAGLAMMGAKDEQEIVSRLYLDMGAPADRERVEALLARAGTGEASAFEFSVHVEGATAASRPVSCRSWVRMGP
jgi:PAS domain S-box-containing protein